MEECLGRVQIPFLKWAGGKRWLAEQHALLLDEKFDRYIEPFLGSGAIFFKLAPDRAILTDKNNRLIETYCSIRDSWQHVESILGHHHKNHSKKYYYAIRAKKLRSAAARAAQFIYLNRTCWNGLYRVNLSGQFNVPIGTKTNVILDTDNFEKISALLTRAEIRCCDFEETLRLAGKGDFVFADPPYTVKHNHNGFIKYNEGLFSWEDQIRLRDSVIAAVGRGAAILITNAYHECVKELYVGIGEQIKLERASVISGDRSARGTYEELVIRCGR